MTRSDYLHSHANVLGVSVSALNLDSAVQLADRWIASANDCAYICVTGVHGVMEAQTNPIVMRILNRALINAADGMPLTWVGRLQGLRQIDRVFGPDFMAEMCRVSVKRGYRNFLYGGKPGVAELLSENLCIKFPGLKVVGTYTPPFGDLTAGHESELIARIHEARPDIVWVGISTPRQERFMAEYANRLNVPLMVGVGAAFDFHTGHIRDCAVWIKRAGLQWVHRLMQDPKRLWRRYLRTHPAFLLQIALQLSGIRTYPSHASINAMDVQRNEIRR
jgi:N-acetylglucosaminyldiphosphoundecaprenol N-acetyl-beta-D-mannosaminyltransferase